MRNLGPADGLELLTVGPPERPGDTPHARLEQIGVLHAAIMARVGFWGYVASGKKRGWRWLYAGGAHLVGKFPAQLSLSHRLSADGRGACRRPARVAHVPDGRGAQWLGDHPDSQHPRA